MKRKMARLFADLKTYFKKSEIGPGMKTTLNNLKKNYQTTPIKLLDPNPKSETIEYAHVGGYHFPDKVIVTNLYLYAKGILGMTLFFNNRQCSYYLREDSEIEIISDDSLLKEYEDYVMKNLPNELSHGFQIGSDPEIFVEDKETGKIVPAFDFLPEKKKPLLHNGGTAYWDGFQAEFTTIPQGCLAYLTDRTFEGLEALFQAALKHNKNVKLSHKSTVEVSKEALESAKDEHVEFGCMPSFNAYGLHGLNIPGRECPVRSAGGHLHFGLGKMEHEDAIPIVKALDAILGVCCVSLFASFDDPRRREMYGLAGEYRLPPHGLEYRTLSNAWLIHPLLTHIVFDLARKVIMFSKRGLMKHWEVPERVTIDTIQNCDVATARTIMEKNKDLLLKIMAVAYRSEDSANEVFKIFMNGLESVIMHPNEVAKNWLLTGSGATGGSWLGHSNSPGKCLVRALPTIKENKKVS